MATNFRILAWRILWTGEPGKLLFMGSQRVRRNLATTHSTGRMRTCSESSPEVVSFFGLGNLFIITFNWFFFFFQYSWFTMLCQFLVYSKMNHLCIYIYPLPFGLPSHSNDHTTLSRVHYMWNLEKMYKRTSWQSRSKDTDIENKCMDAKGEGGGERNWD